MKYKNPGRVVESAYVQYGQQLADATKQSTDLYDDHGIARFTIAGWPMMCGRYVTTFAPAAPAR